MKTLRFWGLAALAIAIPVSAQVAQPGRTAAAKGQPITVYRTASCGCCGKWIEHLKGNGFAPTEHIVESTEAAPPRKGLPAELRSCHSATLDGYAIEGHVPADVIKQLLKERPKVMGIAVPGMPAGSPGMESPNPEPYNVVAYDASGKTSVYARRGEKK